MQAPYLWITRHGGQEEEVVRFSGKTGDVKGATAVRGYAEFLIRQFNLGA